MKRDAHYYATLALCRACGFNKESSLLIAYSSQFVDDAKINLMIIDNPRVGIEHDIVEKQPAFSNMDTCQDYFWLRAFDSENMVRKTCAFHFAPGCKGENFAQRLRCKEESPLILDILNDVLLEDDLIKLGIVLHAYADTFSHQGFSGVLSGVNRIKKWEAKTKVYLGLINNIIYLLKHFNQGKYNDLLDRIIPAYGHGQAMDLPDLPYLLWSYECDYCAKSSCCCNVVKIDNKERFQRAFNGIRRYLKDYLNKHSQYVDSNQKFENFDMFMDNLVLETTDKNREENWISFLIEQKLFNVGELDLIVYKENKWLEEAFANFDPLLFHNWKVEGVKLADDFANSYWYHFYLAVKWYKQKFFEYCSKYQLCFST